jgi:hypothetical protein
MSISAGNRRLLRTPSPEAFSDSSLSGNDKARDSKRRHKEQEVLSNNLLDRRILQQTPQPADAWADALQAIEKSGVKELFEWCRAGCLEEGPFPRGDSPKAELQAAMVALHARLTPGFSPNLPWSEQACRNLLSDINLANRKVYRGRTTTQ